MVSFLKRIFGMGYTFEPHIFKVNDRVYYLGKKWTVIGFSGNEYEITRKSKSGKTLFYTVPMFKPLKPIITTKGA